MSNRGTDIATKRLVIATACIFIPALTIGAPTAAANPKVLTVAALGGAEAAVADALDGRLPAGGNATFAGGLNVVCTESGLTSVVSVNPETGGGVKVASLSLFNWSFGGCTSALGPGGSVITRQLEYVMSMSNAAGLPITIKKPNGIMKLEFEIVPAKGVAACFYQAAEVKGAFENAANKITIANQPVAKSAGGFFCPNALNLSASYTPLEDLTFNPAKKVFVN